MDEPKQSVTLNISAGTIIKVILIILLFALLYFIRDLILVVLTAIVIASAIEPGARFIMRYRVPRVLAVLMVYILVLLLFSGILTLVAPTVVDEVIILFNTLPEVISPEAAATATDEGAGGFSLGFGDLSTNGLVLELQNFVQNLRGNLISSISFVFGGLFSFVLIVVFSFYFAVQERGIEEFLRIVSPVRHQAYITDLWARSQYKIGQWMKGQLALMLFITVLTYLGLLLFGVSYPLTLAVVAGMFELIPIFGPILAAVPAVILAAVNGIGIADPGLTAGLIIALYYLILQQFENHLFYPLVVKKVVGVPPLMVILALIIGAKVAGFLGIILSVPIAAVVQELVSDIQKGKEALAKKQENT